MGKMQRNKGKLGELQARNAARTFWCADHCIRAAQRDGRHGADILHALDRAHIEVKRNKGIAAVRFLDQAERDKADTRYPLVLMREDGGRWVVMFYIEHTADFIEDVMANFKEAGVKICE